MRSDFRVKEKRSRCLQPSKTDMLELVCTLPQLAFFVFTSQMLLKFSPSQTQTAAWFWFRKHAKPCLVDQALCLQRKQWSTRLLFKIKETFEKSLLEPMVLSFNPKLCVKRWLLAIKKIGLAFWVSQVLTTSEQHKKLWKKREDHNPWKSDNNVNWRASTQRGHCKKVTVVTLVDFVRTAAPSLQLSDANMKLFVKKTVHFSLTTKLVEA